MSKIDIIKKTINETALLNQYLKSRGINPEFVSKDQKVAHSKTNQFKVWMNSHMNDPIREEADEKDTVSMDIPFLIRVLELAREDLKSDMDLHRVVEKLIDIRNKGTLTMDDYDFVASLKEEFGQLDELSIDKLEKYRAGAKTHISKLENDFAAGDRSQKRATDIKKRDVGVSRAFHKILKAKQKSTTPAPVKTTPSKPMSVGDAIAKDYKDQEAKRGIGHVRDHVETDGQQLDEISKEKANAYMWSAKDDRQQTDDQINKAMEKQGSGWSKRRHNKIGKLLNKSMKRTNGINRALDRLNKEETVNEMDGDGSGRDGSNRKSLSTYGSRDKHTVSNGPDIHHGPESIMTKKKTIDTFHKELDKLFAKKKQKKVSEAKEANYGGDYQAAVLRFKEKAKQKPVDMASLAARMQAAYKKEDDKVKKESLEPMAACNCAGDGANNPDDTVTSTAKKVKLLLGAKKKTVSEEMYDHEKEDKPVTSPGKKVKVEKPGVDSETKEAPQAAAVLSGGKTLTGEPRDTIEIDPMMKVKQSSPNSQKTV
jgi:hypothetical protein